MSLDQNRTECSVPSSAARELFMLPSTLSDGGSTRQFCSLAKDAVSKAAGSLEPAVAEVQLQGRWEQHSTHRSSVVSEWQPAAREEADIDREADVGPSDALNAG